ncbi:hypothetical protein MASR1M45_31670 [Candidatus Kapaibacterium sp.]
MLRTLISASIISKLRISKNRSVSITIGGTIVTNVLALLLLAVVLEMSRGEIPDGFWTNISISILAFVLVVSFLFPLIGRWFFKNYNDNISQYIFVLGMVFLASFLAELAGIEAIIGAFLAGLALNKLISRTSALMNRIEFVGNALFIPFFLIGVGMLINFRAFISDVDTILVAIFMSVAATLAKYFAAVITQKTFKLSKDEMRIMFGLSNGQAAATLAVVLIGFNIILGTNTNGEPIRLLNEAV